MALPAIQRRFTPEEYLELERKAEFKSEYVAGFIYAMAGATPAHVLINTSLIRDLGTQLKGKPCQVFANDLRVKVSETGMYTYPDVVVACGGARFDDARKDTLINPTVIIEVLSDSTEAYDRGDKFAHYRTLNSLSDYLLVAQDKPRIEHYMRQPEGQWLYSACDRPDQALTIASIGCTLRLADVYDQVTFEAAPEGVPENGANRRV